MAVRTVIEPASVGINRQKMVFETLQLLIPFDLPRERKVRIGQSGDGSYVLVDRLNQNQPVMSFGVGPSVQFEAHLASLGHEVLLFDHTVEKLPEVHQRFRWFREGVEGRSVPQQNLFTLEEHLTKLPKDHNIAVLKMDVEGSEWNVFSETSAEVLRRFEQITFELHDLSRIEQPEFNTMARRLLSKLNSIFTLCHVHANNFSRVRVLADCFPITDALELTYIRSDLVSRASSRTIYPTELDRPNFHQFPDLMLWFFPFMPGSDAIKFTTAS
jgi:hypothetical protein